MLFKSKSSNRLDKAISKLFGGLSSLEAVKEDLVKDSERIDSLIDKLNNDKSTTQANLDKADRILTKLRELIS